MPSYFQNKRILVTGGAGFLGSFLMEEMLKEGARITCLDRLDQGIRRIQHLLGNPSLEFIEADLADYEKVLSAVRGSVFVWHLAGNTDIPRGLRDTSVDLKDAVIATRHVLEAMRASGVREIAFPSSGAIYGEMTSGFRKETDGPALPISLYGAGKIACEAWLSAYAHLFKFRTWIFRFGNVISGRISHGAILDFIRKLRANPRELEVLGDGTQTKSYFLAEECIAGMEFAIKKTAFSENGFCDVFNLGAPDETSILEVARIIMEEMGLKDSKIRIQGGERGWPGDQAKIALNISKVSNLGWAPQYKSAEAVRIAVKRMLAQKDL